MNNFLIKILRLFLKRLAKFIIWRFQPKVIAITGSVGKTSAKEAIYAVLKNHYRVRRSEGNLNNELGVPLAVIGPSIGEWSKEDLKLVSRETPLGKKKIKKIIFWFKIIFFGLIRGLFSSKLIYPEILILEYAADRPGDIKELLEIAKPYVGIITAIGEIPVHVEFFSGPEAVAREKGRIIESLSYNSFAILNFDNEIVVKMKEKTRAKILTFGFGDGADVKISGFENYSENNEPAGISFKIEYGGSFVPVVLKSIFGRAQAYSAAVAACVGLIFDLNLVEISEAFSRNINPIKGRTNLLKGISNSFVVDDSYNASPISMEESLKTLADLSAKRKIAVLGDMLELGKYSEEAHRSVGLLAGEIADVLIAIGPQAKFIAKSAESVGLDRDKIFIFETAADACQFVEDLIKSGDLILIKASRGMRLDKIVEKIAPIV